MFVVLSKQDFDRVHFQELQVTCNFVHVAARRVHGLHVPPEKYFKLEVTS